MWRLQAAKVRLGKDSVQFVREMIEMTTSWIVSFFLLLTPWIQSEQREERESERERERERETSFHYKRFTYKCLLYGYAIRQNKETWNPEGSPPRSQVNGTVLAWTANVTKWAGEPSGISVSIRRSLWTIYNHCFAVRLPVMSFPLLALPDELLVFILERCEARSLNACRLTHSHLRALIDEAPERFYVKVCWKRKEWEGEKFWCTSASFNLNERENCSMSSAITDSATKVLWECQEWLFHTKIDITGRLFSDSLGTTCEMRGSVFFSATKFQDSNKSPSTMARTAHSTTRWRFLCKRVYHVHR